jgi:hypothetical protein
MQHVAQGPRTRSYEKIAARPRPGGALGAAIEQGLTMPRTAPRTPEKRALLVALDERPDRIGDRVRS